MLDHEDAEPQHKLGTIGAVARDCYGNLAAAPLPGAWSTNAGDASATAPSWGLGYFADNTTCAVSRYRIGGEQFQRTVLL